MIASAIRRAGSLGRGQAALRGRRHDVRGEAWKRDLEAHAARVHSQGGEDGVLLRLFERVGIRHRYFVEFGA